MEENNTSINNIKESISKDIDKKRFKKPSIEEIKEYCKSRNNSVDAYEFYDFYESKNWFIGKNKMKDWKAAVRTWEHRQKKNTKTTIQADQDYQKFNEEYLEELLSDD